MESFETQVLEKLPGLAEGTPELREILLANLAMISEIPAPTFEEQDRIRFLQDRFSESGLQNCSTDEMGNALGILNGSSGEKHILLVAHVDTPFDRKVDHTLALSTDRIQGAGVGDNSLGVALLASIPNILEAYGIELKSNLILMGASRSLGRGNLEGLRFFLNNNDLPISSGVCLEGVRLGRLSYTSMGMQRGEIICRVPEEYDWTRFGASGAVLIINQVISRIAEIAVPTKPLTSIIFGSVRGGAGYSISAQEASFGFEIRSESGDNVRNIAQQISDICGEISAMTRAGVNLDIFASREPGGIAYGHPLCRSVRTIMDALSIEPRVRPSISELAAFIDEGIPAVTLGVTEGEHLGTMKETIFLDPLFKGVAQVIGTLLAIDGGHCDDAE